MKQFRFTQTQNGTRTGFWNPDSFLRYLGKWILYLFTLVLFLLLFCIPRCGSTGLTGRVDHRLERPDRSGLPDGELPDGDLPDGEVGTLPERSYDDPGNPVDWITPVANPDPALPSEEDNRVPGLDPGSEVTDPETGRRVDEAHLYVVLDSDNGDEAYNKFARQLSAIYSPDVCQIEYYNTLSKTILLKVNPSKRDEIRTELKNKITDPSFYIVNVEIFGTGHHPNDRAFRYGKTSWHYEPIQAYDAWDITKGRNDVIVAVIDSYFDLNHPDLKNVKIVHPFSYERGTDNVMPPASGADPASLAHGSHVAGIILASMDNDEGACGIAPGCSLMPISLGTEIPNYAIVESVLYAIYKGAAVINLSIGATFDQRVVGRMSIDDQLNIAKSANLEMEALWAYVFKLCNERNVTIVWAAGNDNVLSGMDNSKRDSTTIKVDALNKSLDKAPFSNFGNIPSRAYYNSTVSAPGVDIYSTVPGGEYAPMSGTSMAAPVVTGVVALMKSLNRNISNQEIIRILKATSKPVSNASIGGMVQARDALEAVKKGLLTYDEIDRDHSKLIGTWISTRNLDVTRDDARTGEKVSLTMTFTSETSGNLKLEYVLGDHLGTVCSAPLKVSFGDGKIVVKTTSQPKSSSGDFFGNCVFECTPDDSRLMLVNCIQESGSPTSFNLAKK